MRNVGAIILAAGGSSRLGRPKQFLSWEGDTLIRHAVRAAAEAGCAPIVVVAGRDHARLAEELRDTAAELVVNPDWERGLGTSIRTGVQLFMEPRASAEALVLLACDQPFVRAEVIAALIAQWDSAGHAIVASRYADTLGIPALFDRKCFAELLDLPDTSGAKALIEAKTRDVGEVLFAAGAIDIDTADDYTRVQARAAGA